MDGTKLTGVYKNKTKDGKVYLSGSLGAARLLILPNDFKRNDRDPDYNVLVVPAKEKSAPAAAAPPEGDGL